MNENTKENIDVVGIALDVSGSMFSILSHVSQEIINLLDKFKPKKVVFCSFSDTVSCEILDVVSVKEKIKKCVADGRTAMFDGVTTMLKEMIQLASQGNNVLAVVVTDGMENASVLYKEEDVEDVKKKLRELVGNECIQEICISSTLDEASTLRNSIPGLLRDSSSTASRDTTSISDAFQTVCIQTKSKGKKDEGTHTVHFDFS